MISMNNLHLIGFITREIGGLPRINMDDDKVALYLPMSYQLGGYSVYKSKDNVQLIDMSVEDAIRQVLTAGLTANKKNI